MKFCKDCTFFRPKNWCTAPQLGLDEVTGKPNMHNCYQVRKSLFLCSSTADWFEPRAANALVTKEEE